MKQNKMQASFRALKMVLFFLLPLALPACAGMQDGGKKPIRVLMVGGGSSHDFARWYQHEDARTLSRNGLAVVTYTANTDSIAYYLTGADVLFLTNNQPIGNAAARQAIFGFVASGKGLILAHPALWYNWKDWPEYNLQLASGGSRGHDRYGTFRIEVVNTGHPVTKGVSPRFSLQDERYYYQPDPAGPGITVLANNSVAGSDKIYPAVFVVNNPSARIVGIALGHDAAAHENPEYRALIRNAVQWVARKN